MSEVDFSLEPGGTLRLRCSLTIQQATEAWQTLGTVLAKHDIAAVDLAEVAEFDTAGLQLLLMAKRLASMQGRALSLINHSAAVLSTLSLVNAAGLLGDPVILPSSAQGGGP